MLLFVPLLLAGVASSSALCHATFGLARPLRSYLPSMCLDPSGMSYRELQQACKARGLRATGKAAELRDRLLQQAPAADETAPIIEQQASASEPQMPSEDELAALGLGVSTAMPAEEELGSDEDDSASLAAASTAAVSELGAPEADIFANLLDVDALDADTATTFTADADSSVSTGGLDNSLFDELLNELEESESPYGTFSSASSGPTAAAPTTPDNGGLSDVLGALDELDSVSDFAAEVAKLTGDGAAALPAEEVPSPRRSTAWLHAVTHHPPPPTTTSKPLSATPSAHDSLCTRRRAPCAHHSRCAPLPLHAPHRAGSPPLTPGLAPRPHRSV